MPKLIEMPKIGVNMNDTVITEWLVRPGDTVRAGQPALMAETDKAVQEISITHSGVVLRFLAGEGDTVEVLTPILVLGAEDESCSEAETDALVTPGAAARSPEVEKKAPPAGGASALKPAATSSATGGRMKITPLARKTARRLGIDFHAVPPSPKTGRIAEKEVLAYASVQREPAESLRPAPRLAAGAHCRAHD